MNSDAQNNAQPSGTTPAKEPTCEFAFLNEQAAGARAAMANAGDDLRRNLAVVMSPRMWVKEHPWAFIGVPAAGLSSIAALLGFSFFHKKKTRHRGGFFSRLFSIAPEPEPQPREKKPWWMFILEHGFSLARPAIFSAIATIVGSRFAHHSTGHADPHHDGGQVR